LCTKSKTVDNFETIIRSFFEGCPRDVAVEKSPSFWRRKELLKLKQWSVEVAS
jgi:hypothetical protein